MIFLLGGASHKLARDMKLLIKNALKCVVLWGLSCVAVSLPDDIPVDEIPYPKFDWAGYDFKLCDQLPAPSAIGSGPTEIHWKNDLSEPVTIIWIWPDGRPRFVTKVEPGKGYYTAFFVNHRMAIVSEQQKNCLFAGVIEEGDDGKSIRVSDLIDQSKSYIARTSTASLDIDEIDARDSDLALGQFHALLIANDEYQNLSSLTTPTKDTRSLGHVLESRLGFDVEYLDNATRADILSKINDYKASLTASDNFLLYFAGHGTYDRELGIGYWQPVDALPSEDYSWIETSSISRSLSKFESRNILVVADSCFSAAVMRQSTETYEVVLSKSCILYLINSSTRVAPTSGGLEPVLDSAENGQNSIIASALISELTYSDRVVTASEVFSAVRKRVSQQAAELGLAQMPEFSPLYRAGHDGGDFVFAPSTNE